MNKTFKTLIFIVIIALLSIPFWQEIEEIFHLFSRYDLESIKGYILSFGPWAPIVSALLMIFQSIVAPLPAFLITFANATLFGWVYGALLSWSSAMAGALLCFWIAHFLGRETVERLTSENALRGVDAFFERHGKYAILIARLLPFVSFDIVSYAAGLTTMSFWQFLWATGLGQLPATLIYSYAGEMLTGGAQTFVTALFILFAFSILAMLLRRIYRDRKTANPL